MGFSDSNFDLKETNYESSALQYARNYFFRRIKQIDPEWLKDPKGHFGALWQSSSLPSALNLLFISRLLYSVERCITPESNGVLDKKIYHLVCTCERQFEELLTELVVCGLLTRISTSISMEPRSSFYSDRSVDFNISTREGQKIYVESTVFHLNKLDDWNKAVAQIRFRFEKAISRAKLRRELQLFVPLCSSNHTIDHKAFAKTLCKIREFPAGSCEISAGSDPIEIHWSEPPMVNLDHHGAKLQVNPTTILKSSNIEVVSCAPSFASLKWGRDAEQLIFTSLTNTFKLKRRQFDLLSPYVLYLRIYDSRIPAEGIEDIISRRTFRNDRFAWISAIVLLEIKVDQYSGRSVRATFVFNSNARFAVDKSIFLESKG
ncbi:MAG: hypothetical protein AAF749_04205 [Pseudomonadota bacterium]